MKKGLKILLPAVIIFLIGSVLIPLVFILKVLSADHNAGRFIAPGSTQITIEEPGRYYLWNNFRTVYEGSTYSKSPAVPDGLAFTFTDAKGEPLALTSSMGLSVNLGSSSKNSVGFIDVTTPGTVTVQATGVGEERVFSLSPFELQPFIITLLVAITCALVGIGLGIWGIITISQSSSKNSRQTGITA